MNKIIGNLYEGKLIDMLVKNGWWCHLFAYKPEGQPCDVIALKVGDSYTDGEFMMHLKNKGYSCK